MITDNKEPKNSILLDVLKSILEEFAKQRKQITRLQARLARLERSKR